MSSCLVAMKVVILERIFVFCFLLILHWHCAHGHSSSQILFKLFPQRSLLNKNNIVRTFGVGSVVECGQRCASCFPECKSFNYKHSENFVDTLCDINNTTKRGHPERSLIEDVNSIYGEILNPLFEESIATKPEPEPGLCESQPKNELCHSKIFNGNEELIAKLLEWLKDNSTWTLCYRASLHGWEMPVNFHSNCDLKGATVTIVSVEEGKFILGGYSDISWGENMGQLSSSSAFLFSLRNKDALEPFKSLVRPDQEHLALFLSPIVGPSFGGKYGEELQITSGPKIIPCYAKFGEVFTLPPGYTYDSAETNALLGGKEYFHPSEIETYYLVVN